MPFINTVHENTELLTTSAYQVSVPRNQAQFWNAHKHSESGDNFAETMFEEI